jgi:hypothetical protein
MPDLQDGLADYVRFRLNNRQAAVAVGFQLTQVETQIASTQAVLAQQRAAAVLREAGLLFAWARVRVDAVHELAALTRQPWFDGLTCVSGAAEAASAQPARRNNLDPASRLVDPAHLPDGEGLRLTARLRDGGRLILQLRPVGCPAVQIEQPEVPQSDENTALFRAVLAGLAAEGRLADLVVACAQRFGLALAELPGGMGLGFATPIRPGCEPPGIEVGVARRYFRQRAAWLMADGLSGGPEAADADAALRRLDALHRQLFVLDQHRQQLQAQANNPQYIKQVTEEYEVLLASPHVRSLAIDGERVELCTDAIHVQGVHVGSFSVIVDFSAKTLRIINRTRPLGDGAARFDHPHVRAGVPCLGNIAGPVADLIASRDLPRLIPLIIAFLQSYYARGAYRRLSQWASGDLEPAWSSA